MNLAHLSETPDWKVFLHLGEKILNQPNTYAQATSIEETIHSILGCKAKLWFAQPAYPLPGEPDVTLLPSDTAPGIVQDVFCVYAGFCTGDDIDSRVIISDQNSSHISAAIPLLAQDYLLGILHLDRPNGPVFRKEEIQFLEGLAAYVALGMQVFRQVQLKNWRFEQLSLVRDVSSQLAHNQDVRSLCERVTGLIKETFHYYNISIFTLDDERGVLEFQSIAGHSRRDLNTNPPDPIPLGDGIVGTAAQSGRELIAPDVRQEPLYHPAPSLPETKSEVALPLKVGDRILGVLDLQSEFPNAFHEYDLMVLHSLADSVAIALEGSRLYSNLRWQTDQISAVLDVSYAITSILELDQLLDKVVDLIHDRFGYPYVHLYLAHWGRRMITYAAGSGNRKDTMELQRLTYSIDDPSGMIPHVTRTGETLLANDIQQQPLFRPFDGSPQDTRSELTIPLKFGAEVLGVLDIQSTDTNGFGENEIQIFESLASSVALAIRNATLYRTEQWRRQVADSFREVSHLLSAGASLDVILQQILAELQRNLPIDAAAIWLVDDPEGDFSSISNLIPRAVQGIDQEKLPSIMETPEDTISWMETVMAADSPIIRVPDDPHCPLGKILEFPRDYSSIAVRLMSGNKALGVLSLVHATNGRYGNEARTMTTTFSGYAAVAIQNARLFASSQEQAWISTVLLQVSEACQSITDLDELLETMVRLTPLLAGVNKCAFFIWDEDSQAFSLHAHYGLELPDLGILLLDPSVPAFSNLLSQHTPILINNLEEELHLPIKPETDSHNRIILLPMQSHGQILGAFLVGQQYTQSSAPQEMGFDPNTFSILQGIAHQTSVAIENIHLLETRQQEAYVTAVLLQIAQAVAGQDQLFDTLETILNLLPIFVGVESCVIYLLDDEGLEYLPNAVFTGSHELDEMVLQTTHLRGQYPILDTVSNHGVMAAAPQIDTTTTPLDWSLLSPLSPGIIPTIEETSQNSWIIGFPISVKGQLFGVLLTKHAGSANTFQERRLELINGIAQQIALAIQNDRLKQEMVNQERLEREIQVARQIQQTFLPNRLPKVKGWEIDTRWQTARQVGGDFYDIIRLPKGKLGLVIADVSDKGLPAALYMTVARTLIRSMLNVQSPARVLEKVNKLLLVDSPNGLFVTAVYAILDLEKKELIYTNAGHNRPLIYRSDTNELESLPLGGMALGVMESSKYQEHAIQIHPEDILLLYTDGLPDTLSPEGLSFGEERIGQSLLQTRSGSVKELLQNFDAILKEFRQDAPPSDDLTMVAIRCLREA